MDIYLLSQSLTLTLNQSITVELITLTVVFTTIIIEFIAIKEKNKLPIMRLIYSDVT